MCVCHLTYDLQCNVNKKKFSKIEILLLRVLGILCKILKTLYDCNLQLYSCTD